jgi:hypothetical protein
MRSPLLILLLMSPHSLLGGEYFESFDAPGKPPARQGISWGYIDELSPVKGWKSIIPGDGLAHLTVERQTLKPLPEAQNFWPFQTLSLGLVGIGHRITIKAKNTAIPGVACMLFTYGKGKNVDEIDIEIVADDTRGPLTGHRTDSKGGWSDVRLNTWANAHGEPLLPFRSIHQPILDAQGKKVSHRDGRFHLYTIEWRRDSVRFLIDRVVQAVIKEVVPDTPSQIIIGIRRMPWAGTAHWLGSETMLVDWVDIEPISNEEPLKSKQSH